jgi:hypothetical protein
MAATRLHTYRLRVSTSRRHAIKRTDLDTGINNWWYHQLLAMPATCSYIAQRIPTTLVDRSAHANLILRSARYMLPYTIASVGAPAEQTINS